MEITTTYRPGSRAAVNGLAVVGFVALIVLGMGLAVYSARFVPAAVSGLASAGVYFSSIFQPADDAGLEVVPTEIPFGETPASETPATAATSTPETPVEPAAPAAPSAGPSTTGAYVVSGTAPVSSANLFGEADLIVTITSVGFMETADPDSYVEATEVPDRERGAFKFTVTNIGTNASGSWRFEAEVPTTPSYTFRSPVQQSLLPGERIEFTLGFDRPKAGEDREIEVTVDSEDDVDESNESNNDDSATIDIE